MLSTLRDPRVEPRPGDVLTNGRHAVEVLSYREGLLSCLRYHGPAPCHGCLDCKPFSIELDDFRDSCLTGVLVLAEGIP